MCLHSRALARNNNDIGNTYIYYVNKSVCPSSSYIIYINMKCIIYFTINGFYENLSPKVNLFVN